MIKYKLLLDDGNTISARRSYDNLIMEGDIVKGAYRDEDGNIKETEGVVVDILEEYQI